MTCPIQSKWRGIFSVSYYAFLVELNILVIYKEVRTIKEVFETM